MAARSETQTAVRLAPGPGDPRWPAVRAALVRQQAVTLDHRRRFILAIAAALIDIKTQEER